jgi:hypothetical protein
MASIRDNAIALMNDGNLLRLGQAPTDARRPLMCTTSHAAREMLNALAF